MTARSEPWNRFGVNNVQRVVRSANKFYEGQQPYLVKINWISKPKLINDGTFSFKVNYNNKMCIDRLVDDIGHKLGTNATIIDCKYTSFGDLITVNDCLMSHQLYLDEIVQKIQRHKLSYRFMVQKCNETGRNTSLIFRSPW